MPATRDFPKNTNPQALRAGLVLQSKPEVDCNEAGLEQGTLRFITFNENLKRLKPARGTPCPDFIGGDDLTTRILRKEFDYIGAQTSRIIRNGSSPGIGILEVLCQGAIFDGNSADIPGVVNPANDTASPARTDDPITTPFNPSDSTLTSVSFTAALYLYFFSGASVVPPTIRYFSVDLDYHALDLSFDYVARDRAQRARFIRSSYEFNAATGFLKIDDDGTEMDVAIDRLGITELTGDDIPGSTDVVVAEVRNQTTGNFAHTSIVKENLLPVLKFIGTSGQFKQTPAGQYWSVSETAQIQIGI